MNDEKGFTLIEIITSIAILVLVLMAFLPVFPQTLAWAKDAETDIVSGNLIGRVAHDVRATPAVLSLDTLTPMGERVLSTTDGTLVGLPDYSQAVTLTVGFDDEIGLHRVYIQVFKPGSKKVEAASYVYIDGGGEQ